MEEGYIKYECIWEQKSITIPLIPLTLLNKWRNHLKELDMIGQTPEGNNFGSLSFRNSDGNGFFISGNDTTDLDFLEPEDMAWVEKADLDQNIIWCTGKTKPNIEVMNHAIFYQANLEIKSIILVHCADIWKKNLNKLPTTSLMAGYGTTSFAREVEGLVKKNDIHTNPIILVSSIKNKLFAFGTNLNIVGEALLKAYRL
jgi:L-ribulose-5-phosphate 4-epimerase